MLRSSSVIDNMVQIKGNDVTNIANVSDIR
jgi:hypothetical protein